MTGCTPKTSVSPGDAHPTCSHSRCASSESPTAAVIPGDPEDAHPLEHAVVLADEEVAARIGPQLLVWLVGRREPHHRDAIGVSDTGAGAGTPR